jgi:lipopolysaccharide transport system permease protein
MHRQDGIVSPLMVISSLANHRGLIWQLAKREVISRYRGSVAGVLWAFIHPLIMLAVYTMVFNGVFGARSRSPVDAPVEFGMLLFSGLIIYSFLAESFHRAPYLILNNSNYVKKVVFPLEILPWMSLCAAAFHALVSVSVLVVLYALLYQRLNWTAIFFPVLLVPLALGVVGLSWILSSVGVFVRDIGQAMGPVTTILLFLSPVFYPASAMPERYRWLLDLNPLTFLVEQSQNILILGRLPSWSGLLAYAVVGYLVAWIGLMWFQRTRKAFADVL